MGAAFLTMRARWAKFPGGSFWWDRLPMLESSERSSALISWIMLDFYFWFNFKSDILIPLVPNWGWAFCLAKFGLVLMLFMLKLQDEFELPWSLWFTFFRLMLADSPLDLSDGLFLPFEVLSNWLRNFEKYSWSLVKVLVVGTSRCFFGLPVSFRFLSRWPSWKNGLLLAGVTVSDHSSTSSIVIDWPL